MLSDPEKTEVAIVNLRVSRSLMIQLIIFGPLSVDFFFFNF